MMDTTTAVLIGFSFAIAAIVVITFFWIFQRKGKFRMKNKFVEVTAEGENPKPPTAIAGGVKMKDAEAGRNLKAHAGGVGGIELEKVKAKGDIEATHSPGDPPPKT